MKLKKILIWLRHEIIGYRGKDPFEVFAKYEDAKFENLLSKFVSHIMRQQRENAVIGIKVCEAMIKGSAIFPSYYFPDENLNNRKLKAINKLNLSPFIRVRRK